MRYLNIHAEVFLMSRKKMNYKQSSWSKILRMNTTTLNKIEKGFRLPTEMQKKKLAEKMQKTYAELKIDFIRTI